MYQVDLVHAVRSNPAVDTTARSRRGGRVRCAAAPTASMRVTTRARASCRRSGAAGPRSRPSGASSPRSTTGNAPRTTSCVALRTFVRSVADGAPVAGVGCRPTASRNRSVDETGGPCRRLDERDTTSDVSVRPAARAVAPPPNPGRFTQRGRVPNDQARSCRNIAPQHRAATSRRNIAPQDRAATSRRDLAPGDPAARSSPSHRPHDRDRDDHRAPVRRAELGSEGLNALGGAPLSTVIAGRAACLVTSRRQHGSTAPHS